MKKQMKKLVSLLLCAVMLLALAACSNNQQKDPDPNAGGNPTNNGGSKPSGDVIELSFWHSWSGGNGELLETIINDFNESHSNIHITPTFQGDYWESASKAYTAVATGDSPDLLMMGTDHVGIFMKEGGVLENLVPYMDKNSYNKDDLVAGFTDTYWGEDGGLYALSFGRSTPVLYVNQDMLDKIGAKAPTTWAEMDEISQRLIAEGICEYGYALPYDSWYFLMVVPQMGGTLWNADASALGCVEDGTLAKGLQMFQDQVNNRTLYYGPTKDSSSTCRSLFLDGKCAMYLHSISQLSAIHKNASFNYDVAYVPAGDRQVANTGGCTITMLSSSENKDACWEFLQWFIENDKGAVNICTNIGYVPFTYSMAESAAIKTMWEEMPGAKVAFDQIANFGEDSGRTPSTGDCLNAFMAAMEAVLYDNEDVNKVVADLDNEVKNILS